MKESMWILRLKLANETTFYEIKILPSVRACIREALGQLLDYCHYPSHSKADKLIIVGDAPAQGSDIIYLEAIRRRYRLPLFYRQWDRETERFADAV